MKPAMILSIDIAGKLRIEPGAIFMLKSIYLSFKNKSRLETNPETPRAIYCFYSKMKGEYYIEGKNTRYIGRTMCRRHRERGLRYRFEGRGSNR